jgi:transcriptional regulator with XRE-family HTH domain
MTTAPTISINQEYADLVPPLSAEEYESLKQSIKQNGLWIPIVVNKQGFILDGHHRFKACQELGFEPKTETKDFPDKFHEQMFVIDSNLRRRHLNNFQRIELALKSKSILQEIAKQNQKAGVKIDAATSVRNLTQVGSTCSSDESASATGIGGRVDEQIAKRAGVSRDTVRKIEAIQEAVKQKPHLQHIIKKLDTGEISVNKAIGYIHPQKQLQQQQQKKKNKSHADHRGLMSKSESASADLTPQEKEYAQESKDEFERDEWVDRFIELWTGKNAAEQGRIMSENDAIKGANWRKKLIEESRAFILLKAKRMSEPHVNMTFNYMRTLSMLAEAVGDILYEERESRERKAQMDGA